MHYYINPIWFYLINMLDNLRGFAVGGIILTIALFIIGAIGFMVYGVEECCDFEEFKETLKKFKKPIKITNAILIISIIMTIFIPSKETCIEMLIASQVTEENVTTATETIKETVDYIIEKMNETKE